MAKALSKPSLRAGLTPKNSRRRISLADIAAIVGVSKVTVAKALHGTGGKNAGVSKETAARIRKVAKTLGYRPNPIARQLRGLKSGIIGAIIDSNAPQVISQLISYMETEAHARGYRIMVGQTHGDLKQMEVYAADFADRGIDGVFCAAWDYSDAQRGEYIRRVFSQLNKVVFLGKPLVEEEVHHYVGSDTTDGIVQLMEYLHAKGKRRITLLMPESQSAGMTRRIEGFLAAADKLHLPYGREMVYRIGVDSPLAVTNEHLDRFIHEFLQTNQIDAVLASNDRVAMQTINRLRDLNLRVPGDVSVCGYDNVALSELYRPALTTVDQNTQTVARAAVDMLLSLIDGNEIPQEKRHVQIKPRLVARDSA